MAKRRKQKGLIHAAFALPWWVSVVFGCAGFIVFNWILPSFFVRNQFLFPLAPYLHSVALGVLVFFGILATLGYISAKLRVNKSESTSRLTTPNTPRKHQDSSNSSDQVRPIVQPHITDSNQISNPVRAWNLAGLRALEWKRFELLTAKYYELLGFKSETIRCGADGGIDVKLFKGDLTQPIAIVQCKAWNTPSVGVKELRELLGVMTHAKVKRGIFITTATYTKDAIAFGATNPIQLLDGNSFLEKITALSEQQQIELLQFAFEGDYSTPTCASCGIKMVRRDSKRGAFWGCVNYPRCRSKFPLSHQGRTVTI